MLRTFLALYLVIVWTSGFSQLDRKTSPDTTLRLITHNVWYGFTEQPDRKRLWIQWIQEQRPDILCLQELNEYTSMDLSEDASTWDHSYTVLLKDTGFPTGITSRYPIDDVERYLEGFHHGLMRVRIRGFYFYIIHLHPSNWTARQGEVALIVENIRNLEQNARIVLAGDFNTFSSVDRKYYAHGRLESFFDDRDTRLGEKNLKEGQLDFMVLEQLIKLGLIDTEYHFRPDNYSFTGSFPTAIEKEGEHGDIRRLDYIFVSDNLIGQAIGAQIISNDRTQILSDHLPMQVDFILR